MAWNSAVALSVAHMTEVVFFVERFWISIFGKENHFRFQLALPIQQQKPHSTMAQSWNREKVSGPNLKWFNVSTKKPAQKSVQKAAWRGMTFVSCHPSAEWLVNLLPLLQSFDVPTWPCVTVTWFAKSCEVSKRSKSQRIVGATSSKIDATSTPREKLPGSGHHV